MIPEEAVEAAKAAMFREETTGPRAGASLDQLAQAALTAAAPFLRAQALEDAADELKRRSETFMETMQNMVGNPEYGHEDIIRYGAFSAEANSTAYRLKARAVTERGGE